MRQFSLVVSLPQGCHTHSTGFVKPPDLIIIRQGKRKYNISFLLHPPRYILKNLIQFIVCLVIFETTHPLGPIARLTPACRCPRTTGVVLSMPLEGPQLLKSYFPCGKIHKKAVYKTIMPIQTVTQHTPVTTFRPSLPVIYRRII